LRHGETQWNLEKRCQGITDIHLNETGLRQAREAALTLSAEKIHAVYCSSLQRAVETARIVSEPHGLDVVTDHDFRELNHGDLEGLTFLEIRASFPAFIADWQRRAAELLIPGGERLTEVEDRAWHAMERIQQNHGPKERVLVVSHQFPMLAILCRVTGTPLNQYRSFHVDPCALVRISHDPVEGWRLLEPKGPSLFPVP